jgi:hypothetical protein
VEKREWIDRVFGGSASCSVERLEELDEFCGRDAETLIRLAEVFENSATVLAPYGEDSVNQAFWNLSVGALLAVEDDSIPWALRQRVIDSCVPLFHDFFAIRCQPVLGHLSEEGSPLNSSCYMWWDFDCWRFHAPPAALIDPIRSVLAIDHLACQESALHGLGHLYRRGQATVAIEIIDEFLRHHSNLRVELVEYARKARAGRVL